MAQQCDDASRCKVQESCLLTFMGIQLVKHFVDAVTSVVPSDR